MTEADAGPDADSASHRLLLACSNALVTVRADAAAVHLAWRLDAVAECISWPKAGLYLALEKVRGTSDATVLQVFLRPASWPGGQQTAETLLGSAGLYGLRRASLPAADRESGAEGLQINLSLTAQAPIFLDAMRHQPEGLMLEIRPRRPLPPGVAIAIERLSLFAQHFA